MGFTQAIASGFQNYVNFNGRAARSEFWFWFLFACLVSVVGVVLDLTIFGADGFIFQLIFGLALFLPGLAVSIRRLHDIDSSGWWYLIVFIPLVGIILLIVWACMIGTLGPNRFGPDPLGGTPRY